VEGVKWSVAFLPHVAKSLFMTMRNTKKSLPVPQNLLSKTSPDGMLPIDSILVNINADNFEFSLPRWRLLNAQQLCEKRNWRNYESHK
jgi:hypothetical protein